MRSKQLIQFKPLVLSIHLVTIALGAAMVTSVHAQATVNIAAGDLTQALNQYALQQNVNLILEGQSLTAYKTSGLKGTYSIESGFNQLLAHTPFQIQKVSHGYTLVAKVQPQKVQARDMGQLNRIDIMTTAQQGADRANSGVTQLPVITVAAEQNGSAEDGYLVKNITGAGIWNERSLQDIPYSMSVMSSDLIENMIAKDMQQIFKMNATTQESSKAAYGNGDGSFPTMRGFSVYNPIINGISYAYQNTSIPMMQDIERVEIISGATGFLYGGGRVGGSVNYITKKPTIENLTAVSVGSYGNQSYYGHIDLGGQFDQDNTFGYRVNGFYQDGKLANESGKEQKSISLVMDWKPADNFYTDIKYSYKDTFTKGATNDFSTWAAESLDRESIKKNKNYNPEWLETELKSNKLENSIKYNINDIFTLRTNLFYEKLKYRGDYSEVLVIGGNIIGDYNSYLARSAWSEGKNSGANLFLDSKFDTGSISHTLTMGYSLSSFKSYNSSDGWAYYDFIDDFELNDLKNLQEPDDSLWTNPVGTQPRKPGTKLQYKNILIGDDIVLNKKWSALVGANYATAINKSYAANTEYDQSELTPTLSLIYKPIENLTTYTTYIESLEAGTIVGSTYANENNILDPYKSTQYEIGAKYSLFDEKSLLTAALFRIEKANSYADNSTVTTLGKPTLTQDGEQIHQGIEVGITGKITDHFTLMSGITLMDLSVEKSDNPNLQGKKPTNAVTKMAKIYAEYQVPDIEGLYISGGAYYTGKSYADNINTDILPAYTLFDAGIRYSTKIGSYPTTFNLTGQNLMDKVYWTSGNGLGDPRTVAFSVKTRF